MAPWLNNFTPTDLLRYTEMLLRESLEETTTYSWLKSRHAKPEVQKTIKELEKLKPMVHKMTSENCAKIAVKLDSLIGDVYTNAAILNLFKKLLQEQYTIQLLEFHVQKSKDGKKGVKRVYPALVPDGRSPTVSFILQL